MQFASSSAGPYTALVVAALAAAPLSPAGTALAQEPEPRIQRPIDLSQKPLVRPGTRVRVTASRLFDGRAQGKVESVRPDTLVLKARRMGELILPLAVVDDLSVHRGANQDVFRIVGLFAGAAAGAAVAYSIYPSQRDDLARAAVVSAGGLVGLLIGAVSGYYIDQWAFGERWEPIPVSRIRWETRNLSGESAAGGPAFSIGLSYSF